MQPRAVRSAAMQPRAMRPAQSLPNCHSEAVGRRIQLSMVEVYLIGSFTAHAVQDDSAYIVTLEGAI